jgi:hypothetical protein
MSGILDSYQDSTDQALDVMGARPLEAEKPIPKHSGWTAPVRAVAAGAAEVGANLMDVAGAYGQTAAIQYAGNPLVGEKAQQQAREAYDRLTTEGINWRNPEAKPAYEFSRDMRPDPLTAGLAENMVFGVTKAITKAVGSVATLGPVPGAFAFGVTEGMTAAEDLAEQGVDKATRTKVGALHGAVSTAFVALPVAGQTVKQTVGLVVAGGPLAFMGEMQATKSILESADYAEIAAQYDPLDPVGLAVATLLPAGFGAWAMRGRMGGKPAGTPEAAPDVAPEATAPKATPEQIDAAMVQNLTIARDVHEAADPAPFVQSMEAARGAETATPAIVEPVTVRDAVDATPAKAADTAPGEATADPITTRAEAIKTEQPDMPVALKDDGTHTTAADELDAIRKQAQEGLDDELGALDADLLKVAADCLLN